MTLASGHCKECREATEEERLAQLDDVLQQYDGAPGALIPVLQIAQAIFGYLPEVALRKISLSLGKSYSEVAGVVGFYSFFTTVPRGRHIIRVCLGTACYVRRWQGGAGVSAQRVATGSGRNDGGPEFFVGRRTVLWSLWSGAGNHDR